MGFIVAVIVVVILTVFFFLRYELSYHIFLTSNNVLSRRKRQVKYKADPSIIEYAMDECYSGTLIWQSIANYYMILYYMQSH